MLDLHKKVSFDLPSSKPSGLIVDEDDVSSLGEGTLIFNPALPKKPLGTADNGLDVPKQVSDLKFISIKGNSSNEKRDQTEKIVPQKIFNFLEEEPVEDELLGPLLERIDDSVDNFYSYKSSSNNNSFLANLIDGSVASDDQSDDASSVRSGSSSSVRSGSTSSVKSGSTSSVRSGSTRSSDSSRSSNSMKSRRSKLLVNNCLPVFGFGPSAPMALDYVRARATAFECTEISCSAPSNCGISSILDIPHNQVRPADYNVNVVSFISPVENRIDVYYTTCTLVLICNHPICKERKARIFKMECTLDDLDEFLSSDKEPTSLLAKVAFGGVPQHDNFTTIDDAPSEEQALKKQMNIIHHEIKMLNREHDTLQQNFLFHEKRAKKAREEKERFLIYINRQLREQKNVEEDEYYNKRLNDEIEQSLAANMPCCFGEGQCWSKISQFFSKKKNLNKEKVQDIINQRLKNEAIDKVFFKHQKEGGWLEFGKGHGLMFNSCVENMSPKLIQTMIDQKKKRNAFELQEDPVEINYVAIGPLGQYYVEFSDHSSSFSGPTDLNDILLTTCGPNMKKVKCIAFGATWDTFFVVFKDGSWSYGGNVPDELISKIRINIKFRPELKNVALGPNGEWFLETTTGHFWWFGVKSKCLEVNGKKKMEEKLMGDAEHVVNTGCDDYTVEISVYSKSNSYTILKMPQF